MHRRPRPTSLAGLAVATSLLLGACGASGGSEGGGGEGAAETSEAPTTTEAPAVDPAGAEEVQALMAEHLVEVRTILEQVAVTDTPEDTLATVLEVRDAVDEADVALREIEVADEALAAEVEVFSEAAAGSIDVFDEATAADPATLNPVKRFETRSWPTSYRGPLAIHASLKPDFEFLEDLPIGATIALLPATRVDELPLGAVVGAARLVDVLRMPEKHGDQIDLICSRLGEAYDWQTEMELGNWHGGRYAWLLADAVELDRPMTTRGYQGLFAVPPAIERACMQALVSAYGTARGDAIAAVERAQP